MENLKLLSNAEEMYVKGMYKNSNPNYARVLRHRIRKKLENFEDLCFELTNQEGIDPKIIYKILTINENLSFWLKSKFPRYF